MTANRTGQPTTRDLRPPRILVVDDEPNIRDAIAYTLRREGFEADIAADGPGAIARFRAATPDLIVLDVMLPGIDGLHVCRTIRTESNVPIIFLSARGEEVDRILGLEIGGDDYLTKPFAMRELTARIRAMLRRAGTAGAERAPVELAAPEPLLISAHQLEIDTERRRVVRAGQMVALKPKEFDLLAYLAKRPGRVLSRDVLLREVWGYDFPIDTRTVDVHIRWLRQKLELDPARPVMIETVRGVGYRLTAGDPE